MMAGENLGLHKNEEYWEWLKKMMSRLGQSHLDPEFIEFWEDNYAPGICVHSDYIITADN